MNIHIEKPDSAKADSGFWVGVSGFVCILSSRDKIEVRFGQALAGNAHPRCIKLFESLNPPK